MTNVILINMPFASALVPSIALGLLKAGLTREGISSKALYPSLRFAEIIGLPLYKRISNSETISNSDLVGEWIFSSALFEQSDDDRRAYVDQVLRKKSAVYQGHNQKPTILDAQTIDELMKARDQADSFLAECVERVKSNHPRIVAFTSVFQQHLASLALAKRIKEVQPDVRIVFGGANCENVMGLEMVRQFSFIDAVVSGEGDVVFPQLVKKMLSGSPFADIPGVFTRDNVSWIVEGGRFNAERVRSLDSLPIPDYDDYFESLETCSVEFDADNRPRLLMETSRGCWWGERSHCTFCGLNGDTMAYSSKSSDRAMSELQHLTERFPGRGLSMVDNILDMMYFKEFLPALAKKEVSLDIFYEIKANIKKRQVALLRDAGVTMLQPGVESFSSPVLQLMGKGVKGIMNIQLLKWCKEYGITPFWNILWGFPGEDPEEYKRMADLIPSLHHLRPPVGSGTIRLDRFSPNYVKSHQMGFRNVRPYPAYEFIYNGLSDEAVINLAYFFTFEYGRPQDVPAYTAPLYDAIQKWKKHHPTSGLFYVSKNEMIEIWDTRNCAATSMTILSGWEKDVMEYCDEVRTSKQITDYVTGKHPSVGEAEMRAVLERFLNAQWLISEGQLFMSLIIPHGHYEPAPGVLGKLMQNLTNAKPEQPAMEPALC